ncbi:neuralized-like protein [Anaeramoeba ignava]|uniref:Neuralized-like protein n=1 Tax=Anaeramoeba ignava TaxID=1746090 RepID=A0A9Q0LPF5_ANAIG|nr:neuralized-like protein [Anaeramoeba ignava]
MFQRFKPPQPNRNQNRDRRRSIQNNQNQNNQIRKQDFGFQEVQFFDSLYSSWETYYGFENAQITLYIQRSEMKIECKTETQQNPLNFTIKSGTTHELNGIRYSGQPSYVEWNDGNDKFRIKFHDYFYAKSLDDEIEHLGNQRRRQTIEMSQIDITRMILIDSMKGRYLLNGKEKIAQARILGENLIITILHVAQQTKFTFTGDQMIEIADNHISFEDGTHFNFSEKNEDFKISVRNSCSKQSEENETKNMTIEFLKVGCDYNDFELEEQFEMDSFHIYSEKDVGFTINETNYFPPIGWIRLKMRNQGNKDVSKWSYGYHGTKHQNTKSIVQNGLVIPGNKTQDGTIVEIVKGHIPNQKHIYASQSYLYASHPIYALPVLFEYNDKTYYVRVMFQIRVDKVNITQEQTIGWPDNVPLDTQVPNDSLEWIIFSSDQIVPYGLLIKFDEENPDEIFQKIKENRLEKHNWSHRTTVKETEENINLNKEAPKEQKKKILWVDDEPENNEGIIEVARKVGLEITTVIDTNTAILKYQRNPAKWFLIISDMRRFEVRSGHPNEKREYITAGLTLTELIRKINKDVPIWIYSQYTRAHPHYHSICFHKGVSEVVNVSRILTHFFPYDPIYQSNDYPSVQGLEDFQDSSNEFLDVEYGQIFKVIIPFENSCFVADNDNKTTGFVLNKLIQLL